jgi:hypothetical protein
MRRYMTLAAICLLTLMIFSAPAMAQCPLTTLLAPTGAPGVWAFKVEGFSVIPGIFPVAAIGRFTATIGPATRGILAGPQGNLQTVETVNFGSSLQPINSVVPGNFVLDPDCSGGSLMLGPGFPAGFREFRFVLAAGGTIMYLVNADNNGVVVSGEARRV